MGYVFEGYVTVRRTEAIQQIEYRHLTRKLADGIANIFADLGGEPDYDPKYLCSNETFGFYCEEGHCVYVANKKNTDETPLKDITELE